MRDPGTPRRNPFFEHTFDESQDGDVPFVGGPSETAEPHLHALGDLNDSDSFGESETSGVWGDAWGDARGDDWFATMNDTGEAPRSADALGGIASLVAALAEAQPEAVEHLVTAAHEVVLAVKTVVDAAEQALARQRFDLAEQREEREDPTAPYPQSEGERNSGSGRVDSAYVGDPMDDPISSERFVHPDDLG